MARHMKTFWVRHLGVNAPMTYRQYIGSDAWRWFRADWIRRNGAFCRRCGKPGHELHHATYRRLGHEGDDDVMMLCRACHQSFHQLHGMNLDATLKFCLDGARSPENRQRIKGRKKRKRKAPRPAPKPSRMPDPARLDQLARGHNAVLWRRNTYVKRLIDGSPRWVRLVSAA